MSSSKQSIRTPLARVRGLGSARAGTGDFWQQRLTAIAMTLLIVPAIIIVLKIGSNHAAAQQILGSTMVSIVLILFILTSVWHMKIGLQIVIEDYVHDERLKLVSIIANNFFSAAVALAAIYALLKLSFGV